MKRLFKFGSFLFAGFCVFIAALTSILSNIYSMNSGLLHTGPWPPELLIRPAVMVRRWFFEIPGAELDYHYYSAVGAPDYIGLAIFYYAACLVVVWCWALGKKWNGHR